MNVHEQIAAVRQALDAYSRAYGPVSSEEKDRWGPGSDRRNIRGEIIKLWLGTGIGTPIVDIPFDDLPRHGREICAAYEEMIRGRSELPQDFITKDELRGNIDALRTEYCWVALCVILDRIYLGDVFVGGEPGYKYVKPDIRHQTHEAMSKWYRENEAGMLWDESEGAYTKADASGFSLPELYIFTRNHSWESLTESIRRETGQ